MRILQLLFLGSFLLLPIGCTNSPASGTTKLVKLEAQAKRDTSRVRALNQRAADLMSRGNFVDAETLLKQAIVADAEFGPAQNNLGVVYFNQSKLYAAAQQFLLAAALLPHDPEPRNGLGLVFESSNRFDDAISYYDRARALDPANLEFLGNSARAHIRRGDQTDEVRAMLVKLAANDPRDDWNQWARQTLGHMDRPASTAPAAFERMH